MDTPCSVMYADLKNYGRVSNREAAQLLLKPDTTYGDTSLRARIRDDRTFLSRHVVHTLPGEIPATQYADLAETSVTLARMIIHNLGDSKEVLAQMEGHYAGSASKAMCKVLASFSLDANLYANARDRIFEGTYPSSQSKAKLLIMLFIATGCLGDPAEAIRLVDAFAQGTLSQGLRTTETQVGQGLPTDPRQDQHKDIRLGLIRLIGTAALGSILPLSTSLHGTVIGALASGPDDINDVDYDVSRQHLRIFRGADGIWYAQGLDSTNGTTLISGDTHETIVVEPARHLRKPTLDYPPVPIANSDILCLGRSTHFLVMSVSPPLADAVTRDRYRNGV